MHSKLRGVFCASILFVVWRSPSWAAELLTLQVRETAGIRRFGYPVTAQLKLDPPATAGSRFRLLRDGKPVVAQFRPLQRDGDKLTLVALDFDSNFMPSEVQKYVVEYGEDVVAGQEPDRGMKVDEADDTFRVSNGPNLVWTVSKNLDGLLRSVKTSQWDYLRADSAGLSLRFSDGESSRLGDARQWHTKASVVKQGPIDCMLRFELTQITGVSRGTACTVELEFPRSKSWVHVRWSVEDPKGQVEGLAAELNLQVGEGPTLVDFGADSLVYAAIAEGQVAALEASNSADSTDRASRPFWATYRGRPGALEPYVTGLHHASSSVQGWAHVMDRERCTAVAFADFANRTVDRIEVASDGRLLISRHVGQANVAADSKSLNFWIHFVPFPPHVGAVTSPQSMQSPLEVQCVPSGNANNTQLQKSGDERDTELSREIDALAAQARAALATTAGEITIDGLKESVEVLRDRWGVPHIYAQNPDDLFFAQGFVQAQDRLWQMELWRRTTEGKLAEIIGPDAFERDRFARLIDFRGDMEKEWTSYAPDTRQITEAFVRGVNAYINSCQDKLPIEFQLTGLKPEPWTPRVCLGRMAGLIMCRNATSEVLRAQLVRSAGINLASRLLPIDPYHGIQVPSEFGGNLDGFDQRLVAGFNAATAAIRVPLLDKANSSRDGAQIDGTKTSKASPPATFFSALETPDPFIADLPENMGSNNWVISGRLSNTGKPILANDPHRPINLPSLRYLVHLHCPPQDDASNAVPRTEPHTRSHSGWHVIGGTEPALPGIAIGHNERIAWGLTIVGTDQADIFVEETDPADPNRYRVGTEWQSMRIERDEIRVRGESEPRVVELKFTRHGPVIFEDRSRHRAYALRWAGSEPGTAGYLGALSLARAGNWSEFLSAAARWKVPSENLVYADVDGHIGWIAAALTPVRKSGDGLLPVPAASGEYDWTSFLETSELPQRFDPPEGYIVTANHNILPSQYRRMLSYEWAAPFRFQRIDEVMRRQIERGDKFTIDDSMRLQHDATSIAARQLIDLLRPSRLHSADGDSRDPAESLRPYVEMLCEWDGVLVRDSAAAGLYTVWQTGVTERLLKSRLPQELWASYSNRAPLHVVLDFLKRLDFTRDSLSELERRVILTDSLRDAVTELTKRLGADPSAWRFGKLHEAHFQHMFAETAAKDNGSRPTAHRAAIAAVFNLRSVPRDGDAHAPIATAGPNYQQSTGASYRQVIDLADWDHSVATSVPGQSGQPTSPHYGDLLSLWERGEYFPLAFSRAAVEAVVTERLLLVPQD